MSSSDKGCLYLAVVGCLFILALVGVGKIDNKPDVLLTPVGSSIQATGGLSPGTYPVLDFKTREPVGTLIVPEVEKR